MILSALVARPGTGRISTPCGRYVSADSVSRIFAALTVRTVQEADRWLQRLSRGWAASLADLETYVRLGRMIQALLRKAAVAARSGFSRLDRLRREALARAAHRKAQEETVRAFFEQGEGPGEEMAECKDVDWYGERL